jgi:hypothetical protein
MPVTYFSAHENAFGPSAQHATDERTAYATGYSEGFAYGLFSDAQAAAALIQTTFDHPAYLRGYADGKADAAECRG